MEEQEKYISEMNYFTGDVPEPVKIFSRKILWIF
jgi:hypothetical protein